MTHSDDFITQIQFKLKYEENKWVLDGAMPQNKTLHFTCNGEHLMPKPDHPTADAGYRKSFEEVVRDELGSGADIAAKIKPHE